MANESRACSLSSFTGKTHLSLAASFLKAYAEVNLTKVDEDFHVPLVKFIIEQLNLIGVQKNGRHYSTEVMTTSFLWQLTSTSLYKTLRKLFILPSIGHLQKLSVGNDVKSSTIDTD